MSKIVRGVAKHPEPLRDASGRLVGAEPFEVDLRDAFWRRLWGWKDIVAAPATAAATQATKNAGTPASSAATTEGKA